MRPIIFKSQIESESLSSFYQFEACFYFFIAFYKAAFVSVSKVMAIWAYLTAVLFEK